MEALWLSAPELNSDSSLPSSEMKAPQDVEIGVAVLVLPVSVLSLQWCRPLRSCFLSTDPATSVVTDHLFLVDPSCNKFLQGSWLMATDLEVGEPQRAREMQPPVKNKIARKLIAMSNRELKENLRRRLPASGKQYQGKRKRRKKRKKKRKRAY